MKFILFTYLLVFLWEIIFAEVKCPVSCNATIIYHFVENFCEDHNGTMNGRCCFSSAVSKDLIGLDLQNCGLTNLNITSIACDDIQIMNLQYNNLTKVTIDQTKGMLNLTELYLPYNVDCPGEADAWKFLERNTTEDYTLCKVQENPCDYLNVSCTINGNCLHEGPGYAKCVCKPGNHGYKCLQTGKFPDVIFYTNLIVCTVVVSVFSWFYLRRYATRPQKME